MQHVEKQSINMEKITIEVLMKQMVIRDFGLVMTGPTEIEYSSDKPLPEFLDKQVLWNSKNSDGKEDGYITTPFLNVIDPNMQTGRIKIEIEYY